MGRARDVLQRVTVLSTEGGEITQEDTARGIARCAEAMRLAPDAGVLVAGPRVNAIGYARLALDKLREASSEIYAPELLLVRARCYTDIHDLEAAKRDAERALVIARRNGSVLLAIDARIDEARIEIARGYRDRGEGIASEVAREVEAVGYGRRRSEVEDLSPL